ncbi:PhzF family phenazine biosynthesis protein [Sphingomonas sp.]|uniref:PhzF family phenazine biosynthesis protein n=1 Tax=Sphingomonas sp. TaxID=28214 RepID=UPI00286B5DA8|nr:PhzF family phenazine biosynthesis protein [Sphingomonas sp.]
MADFCLVDVFGTGRFSGNPLPVLFDADDLSDAEMQRITRWFGFSETAFLVTPTEEAADYRVRIFTLDRELPFAGHPTLGACHAWRSHGGTAKGGTIVQQCGAGLIEIRTTEGTLAFAAPPLIRSGPVDEAEVVEIATFLGIERGSIVDSQWVDNGPGWVAVLLASAADALAINPPASAARRFEVGVVGPHSSGGAAYEVRSLFSDHRGAIIEDPITGSLNASLAQWLIASGRFTPPYVARQGTALGRDGRIMIDCDDAGQIWIGGQTMTIASGTVEI